VTSNQSSGQRLAKGVAPSWLVEMEQETADRTDRDWEQRPDLPQPKRPVVAAPAPSAAPAQHVPPGPSAEAPPPPVAELPGDPSWAVQGDQLNVNWASSSAFQEAWDLGLSNGTLTLPEGLLPPGGTSIKLRLSLPDGQLLIIRSSFTPPSTASFQMTMALRHKLKTAMGG
jgi:hypothetical protein